MSRRVGTSKPLPFPFLPKKSVPPKTQAPSPQRANRAPAPRAAGPFAFTRLPEGRFSAPSFLVLRPDHSARSSVQFGISYFSNSCQDGGSLSTSMLSPLPPLSVPPLPPYICLTLSLSSLWHGPRIATPDLVRLYECVKKTRL